MKRVVVLVLVLGAALAGCWRHVTLVPGDAAADVSFHPDSADDAAEVSPHNVDASIDGSPDASTDAGVDSSIDAM